MEQNAPQPITDIALDLSPMMRVYKDGHVERLMGTLRVPPSLDPKTNVESKDVLISPENNVSVRLFTPQGNGNKKLPLLIYFHGGGFCIESAFSPTYHNFLNTVACQGQVVVASVEYRLAPEHPIPIAYQDSWTAVKWVASHSEGRGPEGWINEGVDFDMVFMAGDSAGANIAHNMALKAGDEKFVGIKFKGIILVHPYFWGIEPIGNEAKHPAKEMIPNLWKLTSPGSTGCDDPMVNPTVDLRKMSQLGCTDVLVCVAGDDLLRDRGWSYYEELKKCGWGGQVEFYEIQGEPHVFHLFNPTCDNADKLLKKFVSFIK